MSNHKISKCAKREGFCCLWSFFEANRTTFTSKLYEIVEKSVTMRALQQRRAAWRAGKIKCEECTDCLKLRIKASRSSY